MQEKDIKYSYVFCRKCASFTEITTEYLEEYKTMKNNLVEVLNVWKCSQMTEKDI